jgi:hypothetical protein
MELLKMIGLSVIAMTHFLCGVSAYTLIYITVKKEQSVKLGIANYRGKAFWALLVSLSIIISFYITYVF